MRFKTKVSIFFAAFCVVSSLAWGQIFTSPTSTATGGLFLSDVDIFLSPTKYPDLEFKSFFSAASFQQTTPTVGFATVYNDIYIGFGYQGNLRFNTSVDYTKGQLQFPVAGAGDHGTVRVYDSLPTTLAAGPNNRVSILVGLRDMVRLEDMGFGLNYYSNRRSFSDSDFRAGTTNYKSHKVSNGSIEFGLTWGMTSDLMPQGIRPSAGFTIVSFKDYNTREQYVTHDGVGVAQTRQVGSSQNYSDIIIDGALGGYTILTTPNNLYFYADLGLQLTFRSWKNEYQWFNNNTAPGTTTANRNIARISGHTWTGGTPIGRKYSLWDITPSVGLLWESERISLAASLDLPIGFQNGGPAFQAITYHGFVPNTQELRKDIVAKQSIFNFSPEIALASQFQLLPGRIALNIGGGYVFSSFERTAITITSFDSDPERANIEIENSKAKNVSIDRASSSATLALGATFNLSPNVAFEALNFTNANGFNVFGASSPSITNYSSILFTVKF